MMLLKNIMAKKNIVKLEQQVNPVTIDMASREVGILTGTMNIGCSSVVVLWGAAATKEPTKRRPRSYQHVRGQRSGGVSMNWEALFQNVPNDENTLVILSCLSSELSRHIRNVNKALQEWNLDKVQYDIFPYANALVMRNGSVHQISSSRNAMHKLGVIYTIRNKNVRTRFQ